MELGNRRRLEARRVARVRVRLPGDARAARPRWATTSRSSRGCWRRGARSMRPGRARIRRVRDAINIPKPLQQPHVPIMVGGNGQNVTWRLAARYADELNLDGKSPSEVAAALPIIRSRCEEIGRDPATLARLGEHLGGGRRERGPGASRPARRLPRARREPGHDDHPRVGAHGRCPRVVRQRRAGCGGRAQGVSRPAGEVGAAEHPRTRCEGPIAATAIGPRVPAEPSSRDRRLSCATWWSAIRSP